MANQKSSFNTFLSTFLSVLRGNIVIPLLNLIVLSYVFILQPANYHGQMKELGILKENVKFIFSDGMDSTFSSMLVHFIVIACSIFLTIKAFSAFTNKKQVNVLYSLGITRKNIYLANALAMTVLMAFSTAVPLISSMFLNISYFGASSELFFATTYLLIYFIILSMVAIAVSLTVFSLVGTVPEGILFSIVTILSPTIISASISNLMYKYLYGFAVPYHFINRSIYSIILDSFGMIWESMSKLNPIMFSYDNSLGLFSLTRGDAGQSFEFIKPGFRLLMIWLLVAVCIYALGLYTFKKRKAECCGFLGASKTMLFILNFIISFHIFTSLLRSQDSIILPVISGLTVLLIIYIVTEFIFYRSIKALAKDSRQLIIHAAITTVFVLLFSTGFFGFINRIPDIENIKNIEISSLSGSMFYYDNPRSYPSGDLSFYGLGETVKRYTSDKDKKQILDIHKKLINLKGIKAFNTLAEVSDSEKGANAFIDIKYQMKDGKVFRRSYSVATLSLLEDMLKLEKSDCNLERMKALDPENKKSINMTSNEQWYFDSFKKSIFGDFVSPVIISSDNRKAAELGLLLDNSQCIELSRAVIKDYKELSAEDIYQSKAQELGILYFFSNNHSGFISNYGIDIESTIIRDEPEEIYDIEYFTFGSDGFSVALNEKMVNTMKFLKDNDLLKYLDSGYNKEFVSASFYNADKCLLSINQDMYFYNSTLHFTGSIISDEGYDNFMFENAPELEDKDKVAELFKKGHSSYFLSEKGYVVNFSDENGFNVTRFIAADDIPDDVMRIIKK